MSNAFINPTMVAREALRQLENNLVAAKNVHRGYEEEWKKTPNGYKIGSSVTIKAPVYFRVKDGATIDAVDLYERDTTFSISLRKHVAWVVTASEMTLSIDKFSERFITPAMQSLANYVDTQVLALYKYIPNQVGTPGVTPNSFLTFAEAQAVLNDHSVPNDGRVCIVDPWAQAYMADNLKALFHQSMVDKAITKGEFGDLAGFKMLMSQNVNTHTCGTWAGRTDMYVDDTVAEGDTTINIDQNNAGGAYTITQGDIFTIADVYGVNPITGASTGRLRQFCSDEAVTFTDGGGGDYAADLNCTPGTDPNQIYSASATEAYLPYQNMVALPANNANLTIAGTTGLAHKVNLAMHKDCLGLVMVPLEMPVSASWKAQESYKGYTVRVIRDYDVKYDQEYIRFDILFGLKALNPFMGCRIAG